MRREGERLRQCPWRRRSPRRGRLWGRAHPLGAQRAAARSALPRCCRERPWSGHSLKTPGTHSPRPPWLAEPPPGRGRGPVLLSGASSMGGAAAAGRGAGRARRWLPWLGLCFWAAGAAAARGKRGAERAAEPGGDRGGTRPIGPSPMALAFQVAPCTSPRARSARGGPRVEDLRGDHCLSPTPSLRSAAILQVVGTAGALRCLDSLRSLPFLSPPQLLQTGVPSSLYSSLVLSSPLHFLPKRTRSRVGAPRGVRELLGRRDRVLGDSVGGLEWRSRLFPLGNSTQVEVREARHASGDTNPRSWAALGFLSRSRRVPGKAACAGRA